MLVGAVERVVYGYLSCKIIYSCKIMLYLIGDMLYAIFLAIWF